MAYLLFDIGNTRSKMAVMEGGAMRELVVREQLERDEVAQLTRRYAVEAALACLTGRTPDWEALLPAELRGRLHLLSYRSRFPFAIDYETPETLGMDRVAAVAGARQVAPEGALMVVDAGTCITIDILDSHNVYRGGAILPGLAMRFRALHEQTAALPLVEPTPEERAGQVAPPDYGRSTRDAIRAGVMRAACYEIQGFAERLAEQYSGFKLFLTGGDADFFANQLKFPNFAISNLLFMGLEKLLEMNMKQ